MAKARTTTPKTTAKAAQTTSTESTDESKLDALVQAEEEIKAEAADETTATKTEDKPVEEETADKTVKLAVAPKEDTTEEAEVEPVVVDNSSTAQPVVIESATEGNLKLNATNVDSGVDTVAVRLQYDTDTTDEQVARTAELEAVRKSDEVNNRLPNKPAPEQVDSTVKLNTMIARATAIDTDKIDERQGVHSTMADRATRLVQNSKARNKRTLLDPARDNFSSTETLQLDEIAVPVEGRRPSRMEEQIARQARSANPILRDNSTQPIIDKGRPINVFKAVAQAKNNDGKEAKTYMVSGTSTMSEHLQKTLGLSEERLNDGGFLNTLVDTLDSYVKAMNPSVPKTPAVVSEQQKILIGTLKVILDQNTAVGVVALQIVEQYFFVYRNAAMRGELPFRAFNEVSPDENRLTNLIYAIQEIALHGRARALNNVSIKKLKESVDSESGQLIIVSYLRQG